MTAPSKQETPPKMSELLNKKAYDYFRSSVTYIDDKQAQDMFDQDRSLTALAYKAGWQECIEHLGVTLTPDSVIIHPLKCLPDCMMPDGAEPCAGYHNKMMRLEKAQERIKELEAKLQTTEFDQRELRLFADANIKLIAKYLERIKELEAKLNTKDQIDAWEHPDDANERIKELEAINKDLRKPLIEHNSDWEKVYLRDVVTPLHEHIATLEAENSDLVRRMSELFETRRASDEKVKELRAALEFYADSKIYEHIARRALNGEKK